MTQGASNNVNLSNNNGLVKKQTHTVSCFLKIIPVQDYNLKHVKLCVSEDVNSEKRKIRTFHIRSSKSATGDIILLNSFFKQLNSVFLDKTSVEKVTKSVLVKVFPEMMYTIKLFYNQ